MTKRIGVKQAFSGFRACLIAVLALAALAGCHETPTLVPAPNLLAIEGERAYADVPESLRSCDIPVIFATDRRSSEENGKLKYGYRRSPILAFGTATIGLGQDMTWDRLRAESCATQRKSAIRLSMASVEPQGVFGDPTVAQQISADGEFAEDPAVVEANRAAEAKIHEMLRSRLALTPRKEVFLFVHGYNNSFEDSVYRIGAIWHYMGRAGVPIAYSWPAGSPGLLRGYTHDRESGEFTIFHLKQFIRSVASCPEVEKITFIGHSRGCDVLTSALRELIIEYRGAGESARSKLKIGQLVLAAPDLDLDVTFQRIAAERMGNEVGHITIYVCPDDNAIGVAGWLFSSAQRLGRLREDNLTAAQRASAERLKRFDFIDVRAKLDFMAHGYFTSNPAVLSDLILVLRDDRLPGEANGRPLIDRGGSFWELQTGYPKAAAGAGSSAANGNRSGP